MKVTSVKMILIPSKSKIFKLRSRSRSLVRSRSGPRSGPEGPRTKVPGNGTKFLRN